MLKMGLALDLDSAGDRDAVNDVLQGCAVGHPAPWKREELSVGAGCGGCCDSGVRGGVRAGWAVHGRAIGCGRRGEW